MLKLDGKIDEIIEMIIDGKSYREIANAYKVGLGTLHSYTSIPEHSARVREALQISANTYDDEALEVLKNCDGTKEEISRAKEIAQHLRWRASKRNPKQFGNQIDITSKDEKINNQPIIIDWSNNDKTDTEAEGGE